MRGYYVQERLITFFARIVFDSMITQIVFVMLLKQNFMTMVLMTNQQTFINPNMLYFKQFVIYYSLPLSLIFVFTCILEFNDANWSF